MSSLDAEVCADMINITLMLLEHLNKACLSWGKTCPWPPAVWLCAFVKTGLKKRMDRKSVYAGLACQIHIILQMIESQCQHLTQLLKWRAGLHNKSPPLDLLCVCLDLLLGCSGHTNVDCLIRETWENQIKLCWSQEKYLGFKERGVSLTKI